MDVETTFLNFSNQIKVPMEKVKEINERKKEMVQLLNKRIWKTESDDGHSLFMGSFGRETDISAKNVDLLFLLPKWYKKVYKDEKVDGRNFILETLIEPVENLENIKIFQYEDRVKVFFPDNTNINIVPAFAGLEKTYLIFDEEKKRKLKKIDPLLEAQTMLYYHEKWNRNLKKLCRMARVWKEEWEVSIGGLLIDSMAYYFLKSHKEYQSAGFDVYDRMLRDFMEYLSNQKAWTYSWPAMGSRVKLHRAGNFEFKAYRTLYKIEEAIAFAQKEDEKDALEKWCEVFGNRLIKKEETK